MKRALWFAGLMLAVFPAKSMICSIAWRQTSQNASARVNMMHCISGQ